MNNGIDHTALHRGAKIFMDNGSAKTHEEAMEILNKFGLTIYVGDDIEHSPAAQTALLTLVNVARRTFLAGIDVVGLNDCQSLIPLASCRSLTDAVKALGGSVVSATQKSWPSALIAGGVAPATCNAPTWRLTWEGWRGGVVPQNSKQRLREDQSMMIAAALAAAACAAEVFSFHAGDHPMAGHRASGMSLWNPGANWLEHDDSEVTLDYLPSRLWIIGLGNLGQAIVWLLACLPYENPGETQLILQDYDKISHSNDSTSLLSSIADIGKMKSRVVATWLEERGFSSLLEERRFDRSMRRTKDEPSVALCGVDNANARAALDQAGFSLVVEIGLGGGPQAFRSIAMHTFPATRTAAEIWSKEIGQVSDSYESMPAYQALKENGMEICGVTQLASRTVGSPFVGLIAGCLAVSELLRRLHAGIAMEFVSTSAASLDDVECGKMLTAPYEHGYVDALS